MAVPRRSLPHPGRIHTSAHHRPKLTERSYLGTEVRYVRTLDTFSSGTSLKPALSGRVIIQALSFPFPPGQKTGMLPWPCFEQGQQQSPVRSEHTLPLAEGIFMSPEEQNKAKSASESKHNTQVQVLETNVLTTRYFLYFLSVLYTGQQKKSEIQGQINTLVWNLQKHISQQSVC